MSAAMYPKVAKGFFNFREKYGPVTKLDTRTFLIGPTIGEDIDVEITRGKTLNIKMVAVTDVRLDTGEREVFFELNGHLRSMIIKDMHASKEIVLHPKADKDNVNEVGAPMPGSVIALRIKEGDTVTKGQPVAVLSGMKMEMAVQASRSGYVKSVSVKVGDKIKAEDLICIIDDPAKQTVTKKTKTNSKTKPVERTTE